MRKDYTEMTEKEKPIFEPMTLEAIPARATIHKEPIRLPNGQFLNPRPAWTPVRMATGKGREGDNRNPPPLME